MGFVDQLLLMTCARDDFDKAIVRASMTAELDALVDLLDREVAAYKRQPQFMQEGLAEIMQEFLMPICERIVVLNRGLTKQLV